MILITNNVANAVFVIRSIIIVIARWLGRMRRSLKIVQKDRTYDPQGSLEG